MKWSKFNYVSFPKLSSVETKHVCALDEIFTLHSNKVTENPADASASVSSNSPMRGWVINEGIISTDSIDFARLQGLGVG